MKLNQRNKLVILSILLFLLLSETGCSDEFYLSERETRVYESVFSTESNANLYFDNLAGRSINILFDNSTGTPRISSTNLLSEMRRTRLAGFESGPTAISLEGLSSELEKQLDLWIANRLSLYTGTNAGARLTRLDSVSIGFINNPTFTYHPENQTISFDVRTTIIFNCTIEVTALDWFLDIFFDVNGTYPLMIIVNDLQLTGEANILSPFSDAGQFRFRLTPRRNGVINVFEDGVSVPEEVRNGVRDLIANNLTAPVDELFYQDYDYFSLTDVRMSQTNGQTPATLKVSYKPKAHPFEARISDPMLHVVARATDGKLYHARKSAGVWSSYTTLPLPGASPTPYPSINNEPTLIHSGSGQLELAAIDSSGALIYGHLRDETWGNWRTFTAGGSSPANGYRGKPAIAASAPGQAEIIAADVNGNLWHLRRVNGAWLTPSMIPLSAYAGTSPAPYRDPTACFVGNKIVVVFVDSLRQVRAIAFDLETSIWGQPTSLGTQIRTSLPPAAAASGDGRVDVVYVASDGTPYHRVLDVSATNFVNGIGNIGISRVGSETKLNESFNSAPVVVASGYGQLDLIGRGLGNRIYHNHYVNALAPFTVDGRTVNPGWQNWTSFSENLYGTDMPTDGQMSDYSAAATPTGKVELVARGYSSNNSNPQPLFHNNYDSTRYGRASWKTVGWRGYESEGKQTFIGRPALAVIDRSYGVAFIGSGTGLGQTLHYAHVGANNSASVTMTSTLIRTSSDVIDPIILSSGTGIKDTFVVRKDGKPEHTRHFSDGSGLPTTLSVPAGVTLTKLAATSYGNGMIEFVALASDKRIYHWRYRNRAWSAPQSVAANIISAPALLYIGNGQLELFAVDVDYRFLRYRYTGTGWSNAITVPASFRVNETLFSQKSVSSWGDGTVDLAVISKDTKSLYQRRIGPGDETCTQPFGCPAPRAFNSLGGTVIDTPVLTAFSSTHLNILAMGTDADWYSKRSRVAPIQPILFPPLRDPVLNWTGFDLIGGNNLFIGGAAQGGSRNYAIIAINSSGNIFINRCVNGRWNGFQPVLGQTPQMLFTPAPLPAIAANGS